MKSTPRHVHHHCVPQAGGRTFFGQSQGCTWGVCWEHLLSLSSPTAARAAKLPPGPGAKGPSSTMTWLSPDARLSSHSGTCGQDSREVRIESFSWVLEGLERKPWQLLGCLPGLFLPCACSTWLTSLPTKGCWIHELTRVVNPVVRWCLAVLVLSTVS